jgi:hypothetical protein
MTAGMGIFKGAAAPFAVQLLNTTLALLALVESRQWKQTARRYSGQGGRRSPLRTGGVWIEGV